jgi:uncharacterized protein (TIGR02145 family)
LGNRTKCLPSRADWDILVNNLDGNSSEKLKSTLTWKTKSHNDITNSSGFQALAGGYRDKNGSFMNIGSRGYWWTSESYEEIIRIGSIKTLKKCYGFFILDNPGSAGNTNDENTAFYSVRCLKDIVK